MTLEEMEIIATIITASVGIIIATVSLIIAVIVGFTAHKHNRLSFRPSVYCGIDSDKRGTWITITNAGTGPAEITEFSMKYDEVKLKFDNPQHLSNFFFDTLNLPNGDVLCRNLYPNYVLGVGDEVIILELKTKKDEANEQEYTAWLNALSACKVHVKYESFYKEKFTFTKGSAQ